MKKKLFLATLVLSTFTPNAKAQFNTVWPTTTPTIANTSNATTVGYVGLGIRDFITSTTLPGFNFQIHGTSDFTYQEDDGLGNPSPQSKALKTINAGKTSRIGLTNSTTGLTQNDGVVLRMSENNFFLQNQEIGDLTISSLKNMTLSSSGDFRLGGAKNIISGSKTIFGSTVLYNNTAFVNIHPLVSSNGLYVRSNGSNKYALGLQVQVDTDNAIEVYNAVSTTKNFIVKGSGEVYARKYTTTLAVFPDYVFEDSYKLLSFQDFRAYLKENHRLPNMPSATQIEKDGADLGELNRLLVEKVEELALYILQLEERMKAMENSK